MRWMRWMWRLGVAEKNVTGRRGGARRRWRARNAVWRGLMPQSVCERGRGAGTGTGTGAGAERGAGVDADQVRWLKREQRRRAGWDGGPVQFAISWACMRGMAGRWRRCAVIIITTICLGLREHLRTLRQARHVPAACRQPTTTTTTTTTPWVNTTPRHAMHRPSTATMHSCAHAN